MTAGQASGEGDVRPSPDQDTSTATRATAEVRVKDRWSARLALLLGAAAVASLLLVAGVKSLLLVLLGIAGFAVCAAGVWWYLTSRGRLRSALALVAVAAPLPVLVVYAWAGLLWTVLAALVLASLAGTAGRAALAHGRPAAVMPEARVAAPARPFVIMNPRSGGGKVTRFDLPAKAAALGAEVVLLDADRPTDVAELARDAVAQGADLLGVAGGDGTQALVAEVASELDVPLMVISAGTRNHFALDLGLDRTDPSRCLDALSDGVELHVDLGHINGRPFVNNASFGAYAEVVRDPAYRDDKLRTTLAQLPDLLLGQRGAQLLVSIDGAPPLRSPQAVLVSNNPYETDDIAGLSRRARLDGGRLGVAAVRVGSAPEAAGLLAGAHSRGLTIGTAHEVVVDAQVSKVPVGIDGEAVALSTPVRCTVAPGALRVRVPRLRPGTPPPRGAVNWRRLVDLAFHVGSRSGSGPEDVPGALDDRLTQRRWRPFRSGAASDGTPPGVIPPQR